LKLLAGCAVCCRNGGLGHSLGQRQQCTAAGARPCAECSDHGGLSADVHVVPPMPVSAVHHGLQLGSTLRPPNATVSVMPTPATNFDSRPGPQTADHGPGTPLALSALLAGTLVGTVSNNVVNVPLDAILDAFGAPLGSGVFVVVGFLVTFAATVPLAGWFGDRFGRPTVRHCWPPRSAPPARRPHRRSRG
jgi:hypothetical protein